MLTPDLVQRNRRHAVDEMLHLFGEIREFDFLFGGEARCEFPVDQVATAVVEFQVHFRSGMEDAARLSEIRTSASSVAVGPSRLASQALAGPFTSPTRRTADYDMLMSDSRVVIRVFYRKRSDFILPRRQF